MMLRGEFVFSFLCGEMIKKNLSIDDLAEIIGIQARTLRNKLKGVTDFTWKEVCKIHETFPEFTKEELLQRNDRVA